MMPLYGNHDHVFRHIGPHLTDCAPNSKYAVPYRSFSIPREPTYLAIEPLLQLTFNKSDRL